MEYLLLFLYTCLRELVPAYYFYSIFEKCSPFSKHIIWLSVGCLTCFEYFLVLLYQGQLPILLQYVTSLLYIPLGFFLVRAPKLKITLIMILVAQLTLMVQTLALVVKAQNSLALPDNLAATLILLLANIVLFPLISHLIVKLKDKFIAVLDTDFLVSANIMLLFNFAGTIFLYNFYTLRTWDLFWGRLFMTVPSFLFIYIIYYLAHERSVNKNLIVKQQYLAGLREEEKHYFDYIFTVWQESRRIRHDLRHMALLLKDYLATKEYTKLRHVLQQIQQHTHLSQPKEDSHANS